MSTFTELAPVDILATSLQLSIGYIIERSSALYVNAGKEVTAWIDRSVARIDKLGVRLRKKIAFTPGNSRAIRNTILQ